MLPYVHLVKLFGPPPFPPSSFEKPDWRSFSQEELTRSLMLIVTLILSPLLFRFPACRLLSFFSLVFFRFTPFGKANPAGPSTFLLWSVFTTATNSWPNSFDRIFHRMSALRAAPSPSPSLRGHGTHARVSDDCLQSRWFVF